MLLRKAVLRIEQYKATGQRAPKNYRIYLQKQTTPMKHHSNVVAPERKNKVEEQRGEQRENATGFQSERMDVEPECRRVPDSDSKFVRRAVHVGIGFGLFILTWKIVRRLFKK